MLKDMNKHTPGPWATNGRCIYQEADSPDSRQICEINYLDPDQDHEFNARLIAAAPDLLKVLQMMVSPEKWPNKDGVPLYDYALTTINKAT